MVFDLFMEGVVHIYFDELERCPFQCCIQVSQLLREGCVWGAQELQPIIQNPLVY